MSQGKGEKLPDLTVVIPVLDDATALGTLLGDLARQEGVHLEIVVADGGSRDESLVCARDCADASGLSIRVARCASGRGRQMNEGARLARTSDLLFLHADTRLTDPRLLQRARHHMDLERSRRNDDRIAGHFPLRFGAVESRSPLAYHFYEAKTCLDRADCVNGDQGFWISRRWFEDLGRFDESLPFLEDARISAQIEKNGTWTLLPGRVATSARRFEAEGFLRRQTLNALLRAFEALGEGAFAAGAPELYRAHGGTGKLHLWPFFKSAHYIMASGTLRDAFRRWLRAGDYTREQAWQVAAWMYAWVEWRDGLRPGAKVAPRMERLQQTADKVTDHAAGRLVATGAALGWFYGTWLVLGVRRLLSPSRR